MAVESGGVEVEVGEIVVDVAGVKPAAGAAASDAAPELRERDASA
jgi:hypothetical protein